MQQKQCICRTGRRFWLNAMNAYLPVRPARLFAGANPLLLDHMGRSPRQCCSAAAAELVLYETPREEQQAALERCIALLAAAEAAAAPELQRTRKASAACGRCGGQVELRKCSG